MFIDTKNFINASKLKIGDQFIIPFFLPDAEIYTLTGGGNAKSATGYTYTPSDDETVILVTQREAIMNRLEADILTGDLAGAVACVKDAISMSHNHSHSHSD